MHFPMLFFFFLFPNADQIFGSHLHLVCEHENSTVPQFVRLCIKAVERRGELLMFHTIFCFSVSNQKFNLVTLLELPE